jgi:MFS transporter, OFA family, oxalate/formate antiporter
LLGLGFASCSVVPAVHLLTGWMPERRSAAIGAFMTIGGLGAVAGPLMANGIVSAADSWRTYWWVTALVLCALTVLALVFIKDPPSGSREQRGAAPAREVSSARVYHSAYEWRFREAARTPQFWIISAAMTATLLCVLTTSIWSVTHLRSLDVSTAIAAGVLAAAGAVSALSRAVGGALATRVDPKWLLVMALAAEGTGMAALSMADSWPPLVIFAFGEGFGFGMGLFATAILLVNYFGRADNPEIFGTFNVITTAAMVGPALGGYIAGRYGGFGELFRGYAVVMIAIVVATALMKPPKRPEQLQEGHPAG